MWELSFDPAIQRTFAAQAALPLVGGDPSSNSEWIEWNEAALRAMARVAAKCWAGVDSDHRATLIDDDNLYPIWNESSVYGLRSDSPGYSLRFEGLDESGVADVLRAIYHTAKATPAYAQARWASDRLRGSRDLLRSWLEVAQQVVGELEAIGREQPIGEGRRHGAQIVKAAYEGTPVADLAQAFQRYNGLVQQVVWTILGLAESALPPTTITRSVGTVRCTTAPDRSPFIRLTSQDADPLLRVTHPVRLAMGLPLDGVYSLVGYTFHLAEDASNDCSLVPLSWAAGQWPPNEEADPQ